MYTTIEQQDDCACCEEARGPWAKCGCCKEHGAQEYPLCNNCFDWIRGRITCPFHGDCC